MESINIGPLVWSSMTTLLVVSIALAFQVGNRIAHRLGVATGAALWIILIVALASARLSFVLRYGDLFARTPARILDIRDGGLDFLVGIAGAAVAAAILVLRRQSLRQPIAVSLLAWGLLWAGGRGALALTEKPREIPDVELTDLKGKAVKLSGFSGKPLVVNLWATWCPPCRREMPVFQEAQQKNPDIVFVFADQGEENGTVRQYLSSEGLLLENVLLDSKGLIGSRIGTTGTPVNLFFDAKGKLVQARLGAVSAPMLAHILESLRDGG